MDIHEADERYEAWLRARLPLLDDDLHAKRVEMAQGAFAFLRATFYRWAQVWPLECAELVDAPRVLGVGDLHVANFGTWRDAEGRLAWGVNDFDEASPMPYASDLVRLAASAAVAAREDEIDCDADDACDAVLAGYARGIGRGRGRPFVLAERRGWLGRLAVRRLEDPDAFWAKFEAPKAKPCPAPTSVRRLLNASFVGRGDDGPIVHRASGLGSKGRRRFALVRSWNGGAAAREAKELTVSAWSWEKPTRAPSRIWSDLIERRAARAHDPFFRVAAGWSVRRLSPDCVRVELADLKGRGDELRLLRAMGEETANVHLGTPGAARQIEADLAARPRKWLRRAGAAMAEATVSDWNDWRRGRR
jgi:hypothetical protein